MTKAPTTQVDGAAPSSKWNYHPPLPLANPSIFAWPPEPRFVTRWVLTNWLTLSERVMLVILSFAAWYWLYPSLEDSREFAFGWIFQTWIVNMGLMLAIAGGLH